jgi:hypothetical protein
MEAILLDSRFGVVKLRRVDAAASQNRLPVYSEVGERLSEEA